MVAGKLGEGLVLFECFKGHLECELGTPALALLCHDLLHMQ